MVWKIELTQTAERHLGKLDKQDARRILGFLFEKLHQRENPRELGKALKGSELGEYWRYRVGDYRIIAELEDNILRILVLEIGHRKKIYR